MKKFIILALSLFFTLTAFADNSNEGKQLTGTQIKTLISNKMFAFADAANHNDVSPSFGGRYTLYLVFFNDGKLSGMATPDMRGGRSGDTGRWWIKGDLQCGQYDHWLDHKEFCVTWHEMPNNYIVRFTTGKLSGIIPKNRIQ